MSVKERNSKINWIRSRIFNPKTIETIQSSMKPVLLPLSYIYALGTYIRNISYDRGILKQHIFPTRVVSVGSISAGGSGKTPVTMEIAMALKKHGRVCVVTGNYRGTSPGVSVVSLHGRILKFPPDVMDEAVMIAMKTGCDVIAAKDKLNGVIMAYRMDYDYILMDDALHRRDIHRDLDICVTDRDKPDRDLYIPAGHLRDTAASLNRCHFIIRINPEREKGQAYLRGHYKPTGIFDRQGTPQRCTSAVAFCGIAKPDGFLESLRELGLTIKAQRIFDDHHIYTEKDINNLLNLKQSSGAECLVTTLKDWVKIRKDDIYYLDMKLEIEDINRVLGAIL